MSGTPAHRTSARTTKGKQPERYGFEANTSTANHISQLQSGKVPPIMDHSKMSVPELEKMLMEARELVKKGSEDKMRAEVLLEEFKIMPPEGLHGAQLQRFEARRFMLHQAIDGIAQNSSKINEIKAVLESRAPQSMPSASVPIPNVESPPIRTRSSRASSVVSYQSAASRRSAVNISSKTKLLDLQRRFNQERDNLEESLATLLDQIDPDMVEIGNRALQQKIELHQKKMDMHEQKYERNKLELENEMKLEKEKIIDELNNDQYLGSDEDSTTSSRSRSPVPSNYGTPLPIPEPRIETVVPRNMAHGLQQLSAMPSMQNCTVYLGNSHVNRKLPSYDGDPGTWSTFESAFNRTQGNYSDGENMARLLDALQGKAKDAVKHLTANIANIPRIMDILQRRFGRPEFILDYLVDQAKQCKSPDINKPQSIVDFGTLVESLVTNIENFGKSNYMNDRQLVMELVRKLPGVMRSSWGFHLLDNPGMDSTLKTFSSWLDRQVRQSELFLTPYMSTTDVREKGNKKKSSVNAVSEEKGKKKLKCEFCEKPKHNILKCYAFKKLDHEKKKEFIQENGLCFICLTEKHMAKTCPSKDKVKCEIEGCTFKHQTVMHSSSKSSKKKIVKDETEEELELVDQLDEMNIDKKDSSNHVASVNALSSAHLPVIPVVVKGPNGTKKIYALLDSGASCSILEEDVATSLGLVGKPHTFNVAVLGKETRQEKSSLVHIDVAGSYRNAPTFEMKDVRTIPKLGITGISVNPERLKAKYPHLKSMQMSSCHHATPQMIIGFDNSRLFAARKILEDRTSEAPCAYRSLLGWYVCESKQAKDSCNLFMELGQQDDDLNHMMKEFFSIESFGVKVTKDSHRSQEDRKALQLMEKHTRQLDTGRWETCLLWRDEDCKLPESYNMAKNRLSSMEKKMDSNPMFAQLVQDKFEEYISKGYLKKKNAKSGGPSSNNKLWYLPWFFAFHSSKKPRLVFDGAAKSRGKCLNDFLFKGPDFLESLPGVLMRFRRHAIAVTADIKEMFHQVQLREEDRPSQTILYRGMDRSKPPDEYEMTVLFFGSACSPSSALYVKTVNAMKYVDQHPKVVEAINRDCYMDDLPSGEETVSQAVTLQKVVTSIHQDGGFPMVKWNSSNDKVYEAIPANIRSEKKELMRLNNKSEVEYEKTLGLLWDPSSDCFSFEVKPKPQHLDVFEGKKTPTKREICSILMSLFDPLGFVAPVKTKGLIIMQSVWRTGIGWDDEVPADLAHDWGTWMEELEAVKGLSIDRRLSTSSLQDADDIQLHIFVDASQEAYAASAFLRIQTGGSVSTTFVLGKSRVAPLKYLTIPRMELQAAVMGTRLAEAVKAAYPDMKISKIVFWSDSRTVLCWIRSSKGKLNVFVANRIGEILESTHAQSWRWVPTKENPSDAATRSNELSLQTWLTAPDFLLQTEADWPKEKINQSPDLEDSEEIYALEDVALFEDCDALKLVEVLPEITRFSSWFRLVRVTACVLWAARRFKGLLRSTEKGQPYITKVDVDKAKHLWTIKSQLSFQSDKRDLIKQGAVSKKSRLYKFSPILKNGVIVMDSRIKGAEASEVVRQPPILDPKDTYTKLMVKWFHHTGQHYGQERVINELRQHAWIISCREAVRKCKSECLICKRKSVVPYPPEMGQLPNARMEPGNAAFYHCGVDYFGPIDVKIRRSTEKRWGVIFTCLTTRAVHLDLAQSLSSSDFISSLTRFIAVRGKPGHIWSDNGTNFVGAEREIREHLQKWNMSDLNAECQVRGMEFHFIPPGSPHMGGCWERLIRDVKKILRQLLKTAEPGEDLLRTLFAEVTGILNSRPITRASPDPEDLSCLTPNDLLNIRCVVGPSIAGVYEEHHRYAKSWERCQLLTRQFWERWSKEYLPWLAQRKKWFKKSKPLEVGDMVVVLEDNAPRNSWKLGIITKTFPQDGQVRKVEVKVAHVDPKDPKGRVKFSHLTRPTVKIGPLSLDMETSVSGGSVAEADNGPII